MKNFLKLTKIKIVLAGIFLVVVYFLVNFYGLHTILIEKITDENPEAKITIYLEAIKNRDKTEALKIWELSDLTNEKISLLENRRENLTKDLIENGVKEFNILKIEWWSTCCEPDVIDDSNWANGARVYVQLTNSDNANPLYIFDVFVSKGHREPGVENSIRHWVIRDIYLENQEPLFWQYSFVGSIVTIEPFV